MGLLFESKRFWLLSYVICLFIPGTLYYCFWGNSTAKTIGLMFVQVQIIMFIFFWLILVIKWKLFCRVVAALFYLGITIYEGVNGNLIKWYVIVPVFLVAEIYMLWNLGGVANCVVASGYRDRLGSKINAGRYTYGAYADDLNDYNERNGLNFFTKVRKKVEPNWKRLDFNYTALEMFYFENAITGIDFSKLDKKESKLDKINSRLNDKLCALDSNRNIGEEKSAIDRIMLKAKSAGLDISGYDASSVKLESVRKKNVKNSKSILRKRL